MGEHRVAKFCIKNTTRGSSRDTNNNNKLSKCIVQWSVGVVIELYRFQDDVTFERYKERSKMLWLLTVVYEKFNTYKCQTDNLINLVLRVLFLRSYDFSFIFIVVYEAPSHDFLNKKLSFGENCNQNIVQSSSSSEGLMNKNKVHNMDDIRS